MPIPRDKRQSIEAALRRFYLEDFPFGKRHLIESRQAPGVDIEDTNLWMRHRNALDRVAEVQAMLAQGHIPDGTDDPERIMEWASYLIRNTAVEAWVQASSYIVGRLYILIRQFYTIGNRGEARKHLAKALEHQGRARMARSTAMGGSEGAIPHYRKAVEEASKGIQHLREANPRESMMFWVTIGSFIVGLGGLAASILMYFAR